MALNQCNFIGNLGKDPETRYTQDGKAVTSFSIAVTEKWKKDGEAKEKTEWVRVVTFGKLAEICEKYLVKGKQVFISGKMVTRQWEKDGVTRYTTEIVASEMQMLGGRQDPMRGNPAGQKTATDYQVNGSQPPEDDITF